MIEHHKRMLVPVLPLLYDLAKCDQSSDHRRPWTFTDSCPVCGGVKAFLQWLEMETEMVKAKKGETK